MNKKDKDQDPSPSLPHPAIDLLDGETTQNPKPEICKNKPPTPKKAGHEHPSSKHKPEKGPSSLLNLSHDSLNTPCDDETIDFSTQEVKVELKESETPLQPVVSEITLALSGDETMEFEKNQQIVTQDSSNSNPFEKFIGPLEKPKTANKAFGSISDFLLFFENRNHEIKNFAKKFKEMENSDSILSLKILNEEIAPALCKDFKTMQAEFKNHESFSNKAQVVNNNKENEQLKKALSKFIQTMKIQKERKSEYVQLFEKEFKSVEDFYKQILHAYTIPGFLYLRMNEYLRTENWVKLDDLLVYTYCLFKAYLWGPTGFTDADSFEFLKSKSEEGKLTLYRRADFDQLSLDFYDLDKTKEFSWTGVTSTSLLESATRPFSGKKPDKKPVLIIIEVDLQDLQPEDFNALYLAKISRCPAEEEVALAPGSIFELLDINNDKAEVEMRLRLITNAKILAQQGKFLHGMLQEVMRNEDELKLVCLKEKELSRAINHCRGNQLVKNLEFFLCHFNEWSAKVLLDVLPTIKNLDSFAFNSVLLEKEHFDQIMRFLGDLKINKLEILYSPGDENDIKSFIRCIRYFGSFRVLKLSFENSKIDGTLIQELYHEAIEYLDSECVFELSFLNHCDVVVKCLNKSNYKQSFGNWLRQKWPIKSESYTYFSKENEEKEEFKDENSPHEENTLNGKKGLFGYSLGDNSRLPETTLLGALEDKYIFTQPLENPIESEKQPLETLNLNLEKCKNLDDPNLKSLGCEGIQLLQSLETLNLNFNKCNAITDKALEVLSNDVLRKLTWLNNLHLSFEECEKITDEGLKRLAFDGIQYQFLTGLHLSFSGCSAITNEGLRSLSLEGIAKIRDSLTSLHLNFERCSGITDEGLENLFHDDGFESLTSLDLNFNSCSGLTNKGIEILTRKGLQKFKKCLKMLSLSFKGCSEITDEWLRTLSCEGISHLESLTNLSLDFSGDWDSKITDQGIFHLSIQHLSSLTVLRLSFDHCEQITNEGLKSLSISNKLIMLHLSFDDCNEITDDGLDDLSKKISHLKSLEHLHLSFRNGKMTDNGLGLLCSQGIKSLRKLNILHLGFGTGDELFHPDCYTITDQSLKSIGSEAIKHLPELKTLHLDLQGCSEITARGLEDLCCDGIQYLRNLTDLHLDFSECKAITDEGLEILSHQGIFPLKHSLKALSLNFFGCPKLSNVGLQSLWNKGIQYLGQLTTLYLEFWHSGKIEISQLLFLQYQINLLNLPQLQLPLEIPWENYPFRISSPRFQFSNSPNSASVLCKEILGFKVSTEEIDSQKVENLTLKFEQGPDITDLDISESLFHSNKMKTFKHLRTLHLTFDGCGMITDFTLHNLCSQGLQHFESLSSLHLSFNGCSRITDTGLKCLGIQPLKSLTSLYLSFNNCDLITNQGIKKFWNHGLSHLESLKSMYLSFQLYDRINNKELERLDFNDMKSLGSFFVDFSGTKITERLKKQFSQSSSSSFILMSQTSVNHQLIGTSHFTRQKIGGDQGKYQIQPIKGDSVEIVKSFMFTRYLGRNHYVFDAHHFDDFVENELMFAKIHIPDDTLNSAKKDIIALILLSGIRKFEEKAKQFIDEQAGQEIQYLESLTSLNLILDACTKYITDKTLNTMFLRVFQHLKSLTNLYLSFSRCDRITSIGLKNLGSQGIRSLTSLTTLHLSFKEGVQITDGELKTLSFEGIQSLKYLTTLHLEFKKCQGITDEGLQNLWTDGILHLKSLKTLDLGFERCSQITGAGLENLKIEYLKFLTILHLNFDHFKDEGVENLSVGVIQHIAGLTTLHLTFDGNEQITDSSLEYLGSQGISHLKLLTNLHLSFDSCRCITDKGVQSLNLSNFKFLTLLYLNFDQCFNLTDQSLRSLTFHLRSLEILHLSFRGCSSAVTDQALKDLGIQYLTSLHALYLCFDGCEEITDEGIEALCSSGIQSLEFLKTLHLSFSYCQNITEKGLESLQNRIKHLSLLENLHLCFVACQDISHAQLSLLQDLPQLQQRPLEILDNTIFSESYLHNQRFLGATIPSQRLDESYDETGSPVSYQSPKDRFYSLSKFNTNLKVAMLQKLQNNKNKTLRFEDSFHATDLGISPNCYYCSDEMQNFDRLEKLQIAINHFEDFEIPCYLIRSLCRDVLQRLRSLKILHISFEMPSNIIGYEEWKILWSEGISSLAELTQLHLSFRECNYLSDNELADPSSGGFQNLKQLIELSLSFKGCQGEGLTSLCTDRIQNLPQLNVLSLSFNDCWDLTDNGLTSLCSDGIQYLKRLKTLHLSFDRCKKITDEALKSVSLIGILNLSSIQDLKLSFLDCPKISNSSYQAFIKILEYFGYKSGDQNSKDFEDEEANC